MNHESAVMFVTLLWAVIFTEHCSGALHSNIHQQQSHVGSGLVQNNASGSLAKVAVPIRDNDELAVSNMTSVPQFGDTIQCIEACGNETDNNQFCNITVPIDDPCIDQDSENHKPTCNIDCMEAHVLWLETCPVFSGLSHMVKEKIRFWLDGVFKVIRCFNIFLHIAERYNKYQCISTP